uniref:Serpin domain-containing protein n=1 Tax=Wuchereria bancrofti TaxID=6293 RepID=A0AAF5RUP0_WUCBA
MMIDDDDDDSSKKSDQWEVDHLVGINKMAGWKKYARIILPHIGLIILSLLYAIGGALSFYHLERPNEIAVRRESLKDISAQRKLMLDELWIIHCYQNVLSHQLLSFIFFASIALCTLFWPTTTAYELNYYLDKYARDTIQSIHANFSLRLLSNAADELNAVLSPLSLAITLSLTSAAASGITKLQINDVFAKGFSYNAVQKYYSLLANRLLPGNNGTIVAPGLLVVLHLCGRGTLSNAMIDIARDYMADILQFDCKNRSATATFINQWIANQTKSEFKIFARNVYNADWHFMLVDSFYLNAAWHYPFDERKTTAKDFYVNEHTITQVEMMSMWAFDKFKYTEDADVQVLGLPYQVDSNLFLYIFLPREKFALRSVVRELTGRRLLFLIARCKIVDVEVELPRFSIENHFELNLPLANLGIVEAFTSRADFPAISLQKMHVSTLIQKTQFEINEKGSYPVNSTHEIINDELTVLWQGGHIKFIANHPFMFIITKIDQMILIGHYFS